MLSWISESPMKKPMKPMKLDPALPMWQIDH